MSSRISAGPLSMEANGPGTLVLCRVIDSMACVDPRGNEPAQSLALP
jgi:hypothetical protein